MDYLIVAVVIGVFLAGIWVLGKKKRTAHVNAVETTANLITQEHQGELVGLVAYQGGLSQLPKPCFLYLGVAEDGLVFYEKERFAAKLEFGDCVNAEKFSVKSKSGNFMKSTVMLGPLVPILFKDKIRHFLTVEYRDMDNEENHILLEITDKKLQSEIYDKVFAGLKKYTQAKNRKIKLVK